MVNIVEEVMNVCRGSVTVVPKLSVSENRNETETIFEFRPKTETKIENSLHFCFDLICIFTHQICAKMTLDSLINRIFTLLNLHLR
jgi:hypothetical protein